MITMPGVYAPQADSSLLAEALRRGGICAGMDVLDVCTGSGVLGVYAARLARVTAVDVARRAVLTARLNALLARQRLTVRRGDLFASLPVRSFDVIVSNPPYVPAPGARLPRRGAARAWDAGHDGRAFVDRICEDAPAVLRPHGVLLADPHAWVIPRLGGRAKAAMVAIEFDEFGAGRAENMHFQLFANLMRDLDLDCSYGRYLDAAPAEVLATVNLMSQFGLHRRLRGALVGHFASLEVTSSPGSRRMAQAMRRAGAGPAAELFYDEHVEADAVHEQVVRRDVIGGLLTDEPNLEEDVVFGIQAISLLEEPLSAHTLSNWHNGRTALRWPLDGPPN
jgi:SAM-dependent methyltransferase